MLSKNIHALEKYACSSKNIHSCYLYLVTIRGELCIGPLADSIGIWRNMQFNTIQKYLRKCPFWHVGYQTKVPISGTDHPYYDIKVPLCLFLNNFFVQKTKVFHIVFHRLSTPVTVPAGTSTRTSNVCLCQ